ncbi:hypothetical protein EGI22_01930 [Lacihabitans sp. LS3-19]|uniref:hypothetical protein n=1 Tax=Lacihabitans sp. LS3-19 TaxID=2487335 RepID=UPI0020CF8857|nr:hypothetical protein [Lacihabitans sp. LS3-19]MCP9766649.1 hypothetical protein [Lacihabitans sp. LS3-19]
MNNHLSFWRIWHNKEKWPLFFGLFIVIFLITFSLYAWNIGLENIIHWNVLSELHEKIISSNSFYYDEFKFSASTPVWYIKERYMPSLVIVNSLPFYILLGGSFVGLSFLLIGFARLKGISFLIGALVLGGILIGLRSESVFLSNSNWPFLVTFVLSGGLYYYFNNFGQKIDTSKNLIFWLLLWALLIIGAYFFSAINQPLLSLAAYGLVGFMLITAIFIFMVSHEIVAGLVWLVSKNSQKGKSSLPQFLLISGIFLVNILLVYLENSKAIEKSSFVLAPIFIFVLSVILGLWGFRQYVDQKEVFSFQRSGVWLYLGFAIISCSTIAFIFATGNDPLIEVAEDYISITQLTMGLSFVVYVLINYIQLLKQGLEVHKVLYKAPFNKLVYARTIAVFLVLFLFSYKNFYAYNQALAGINNTIADFYLKEGDLKTAETFYKKSTHFELYNHKANISLASLALSQNDKINAAFFFNQTISQKPSPYAFAGLSASLENENMYFDALFALQNGLKTFPKNNQLLTNLAYLQGKSNLTDSVLINLDIALKACDKCETENTNFLAFLIENAKLEKLQEMTNLSENLNYNSLKANRFAIDRILEKENTFADFELTKDSALDMSRAAFLFNAISNPKTENKTKIDAKALMSLQKNSYNEQLFESLSWVFAEQQYYRQSKAEGIKQLYALAEANTKNKLIYNQNLGLWMMKEGIADKAIERLRMAGDLSSVALLENANLQSKMKVDLEKQAQNLSVGLNENNYKEAINKAPFNAFLIKNISDMLSAKNKDLEAYNVVFYAADVNSTSSLLLKTLVKKAIAISEFEYAQDGINKLESMGYLKEASELKTELKTKREKIQSDVF